MAIIDVVKWEVNRDDFCYKFPSQDLRIGTPIIIYPAQTAFFVKGGQICDAFSEPGTHILSTENIPILSKVLNIPFGGDSPFQAEVWFINQITKLDMKWGTTVPIQVEDPKYGIIVPVRAFGQYGIKVSNPRRFLETLIGNMSTFSALAIDQYFKGKLLSNINVLLANNIIKEKVSILDINSELLNIAALCQNDLNQFFDKYGIELVDFTIVSINVPQDDPSLVKLKEAKATVAQLNITGRDVYQMQRSFDVLDKAAENSGTGSQLMGIGVGMGLGNMMRGVVGSNMDLNPQMPPTPMEKTYFVYVNGQQLSGQTAAQIATMRAQGIINDDTLVWTVGMETWVPIKTIPALASPCPPPIPPIIPSQK